jgi:hypothetical protein
MSEYKLIDQNVDIFTYALLAPNNTIGEDDKFPLNQKYWTTVETNTADPKNAQKGKFFTPRTFTKQETVTIKNILSNGGTKNVIFDVNGNIYSVKWWDANKSKSPEDFVKQALDDDKKPEEEIFLNPLVTFTKPTLNGALPDTSALMLFNQVNNMNSAFSANSIDKTDITIRNIGNGAAYIPSTQYYYFLYTDGTQWKLLYNPMHRENLATAWMNAGDKCDPIKDKDCIMQNKEKWLNSTFSNHAMEQYCSIMSSGAPGTTEGHYFYDPSCLCMAPFYINDDGKTYIGPKDPNNTSETPKYLYSIYNVVYGGNNTFLEGSQKIKAEDLQNFEGPYEFCRAPACTRNTNYYAPTSFITKVNEQRQSKCDDINVSVTNCNTIFSAAGGNINVKDSNLSSDCAESGQQSNKMDYAYLNGGCKNWCVGGSKYYGFADCLKNAPKAIPQYNIKGYKCDTSSQPGSCVEAQGKTGDPSWYKTKDECLLQSGCTCAINHECAKTDQNSMCVESVNGKYSSLTSCKIDCAPVVTPPSKKSHTGLIIGIIVGVILLIAACIFIFLYFRKKKSVNK